MIVYVSDTIIKYNLVRPLYQPDKFIKIACIDWIVGNVEIFIINLKDFPELKKGKFKIEKVNIKDLSKIKELMLTNEELGLTLLKNILLTKVNTDA